MGLENYPLDDFLITFVSTEEKEQIFDEAEKQHKPAFVFVREAILSKLPMELKDGKAKKQNS